MGIDSKTEDNKDVEIMDWDDIISKVSDKKTDIMTRLKKGLVCFSIIFVFLTSTYLTVVYSNIPFIEKWRTIYIETAMTTNTHQWLATLIFPKSVIDKVMANRKQDLDAQSNINSTWEHTEVEDKEQKSFFEKYWELDTKEFKKYLEKNPSLLKNGYDSIYINHLHNTNVLKTTKGDRLLVLDTENNLMIIAVKGEGYQGKMAIIKNPEQVELAKSQALGSFGQEAETFGRNHDALLVINASGFKDAHGEGSGGQVKGAVIIDGVDYGTAAPDMTWKFCGMKKDNRMYVGSYPYNDVSSYRWGVEFLPALIVDGKSVVDGTFGMGIQPRATIGQSRDGDMLLLIVDGRQVGYSLGCTVEDCKNIFMRYNGYQGFNLDGGSSAVMWYDGEYITRSSSVSGKGRYMPDAFIVKKAPKDENTVINSIPGK